MKIIESVQIEFLLQPIKLNFIYWNTYSVCKWWHDWSSQAYYLRTFYLIFFFPLALASFRFFFSCVPLFPPDFGQELHSKEFKKIETTWCDMQFRISFVLIGFKSLIKKLFEVGNYNSILKLKYSNSNRDFINVYNLQ